MRSNNIKSKHSELCARFPRGKRLSFPISKFTPFAAILSRSELREFRSSLLRGNEWGYLCSPLTAHLGLPADSDDCVKGLKALSNQAMRGVTSYYKVYPEEKTAQNPELDNVGLYCLHGDNGKKRPFVIMLAGGGFTSVCTLWESLPVCAQFNKMGYTCFCVQYRTGKNFGEVPPNSQVMDDVAACISYITAHADIFNVLTDGYLIGGFSAGAMIASMWANTDIGYESYKLARPGAVCLIYGLNEQYAKNGYGLPTFSLYCLKDKFFKDCSVFTDLEKRLLQNGIPCLFKGVDARHGFGAGSGTPAQGWTEAAESFWQECISSDKSLSE